MLKKRLDRVKGFDASKLEHFINDLAGDLNPLTLILHGSLAKGGFVDKFSDIDIIVVSPKLRKVEVKERFTRLLEASQKYSLKADITAYTPREFLEMIRELNPFALDAIFYGIPLYDEGGFWKVASREFEKCRRKYNLRKTESNGWTWGKG
ncbi:MAG: nucleotidyltransferase domain-containing protein [Candidatus Bathyarchaeia archaeon]|nr:nucleotidyltransferase domain-containing protein [Candidatus Bathyarchaeota archaeon]